MDLVSSPPHVSQKSCEEAFIILCKSLVGADIPSEVVQLLTASLSDPSLTLRNTALRALSELDPASLPQDALSLQVALLVARHDGNEENRSLAEK